MSSRAPAIGIDLGTTYSCVAVFKHGKAEVIANDMGNRTTPSVVAFLDSEMLVGEAAASQAARNLPNTIFDAKRMVGRPFADPKLQEDMKQWPFAVINIHDRPKIQVFINGQKKNFYPDEISSFVLSKMKKTAEDFLGKAVASAVITVPAYFNDDQRRATKDAGTIAELNVMGIINEPTAAALAYGLETKVETKQNVLIFDLGGGTFDVSILTIKNGNFKVKATAGDTHLGGEDFDNRLVDYLVAEFKRKHKLDLKGNTRVIRRLKMAAERAKRTLSNATNADLEIGFEGEDYYFPITRARFEELNKDLFQATIECVKKSLNDAKLDKKAIDEIVLVGGSTRIPKVQKILQEFFDGKELNKSINPDEAVAYGAAVHAAILNGDNSQEINQVILEDVAPLSLGIKANLDHQMSVVVPRNTTIPTKKTERFSTSADGQRTVRFAVYEGERYFAKDNNLLGEFCLNDVKPAPAYEEQFDVTFSIDADGILTVTAVDIRSGSHKAITIANDGRLSKKTIKRMIKEARKYRSEDQKSLKRKAIQMKLESYCNNTSDFVQSNKELKKMSDSDTERALEKCTEALSWLEVNPVEEPEEYEQRLQNLEALWKPIINKYNKYSNAYKKDVNLGNVD